MDFKSMFQETAAEEAGGFALIDVGTYEAELVDCKLDMTKSPERLTFEYQLTQEPYVGRKLWSNYNLEGRGIGFLKKDLGILKLDYSDIGSPEDIASLVWDAMPVPVIVYVAQKEWQGKMYNNTYLNEILDAPAVSETTRPASPLNQKEATRQASKKTAPPSGKQENKPPQRAPQKTKPAPKRGPVEPSFDDENGEIPF